MTSRWWLHCEKMLDAMAVQAHFSIRLAYLRGAEDREKMLRI